MTKRKGKTRAFLSGTEQVVEQKFILGKEMLTKLRALPLNYGKPRLREVMALTNTKHLQRKRKLPQLLNDDIKGEDPLCKEQTDRKFNKRQTMRASSKHVDYQEAGGSISSNLEESKHDCPPSLSISYLDDQFVRMAIPVGPHFQADIPEWGGPSTEVSLNGDPDSSKWFRTKVWPLQRRNVATSRAVGKGRPSSCSCASPGSTTCARHHVLEKNRLLQSDLGPLYHIWNFDEMGEEFSKSWTVEEQGKFEVLAKEQSSRTNLLQNAMISFPSKCMKDIIGYYFNVFIPRFMSFQTKSLAEEVEGDVDDVKDAYNLHTRRRHK